MSLSTATAPDATAMLAIDFCISVERQMNMDAPFDDYVAFESREREREYAIVTRSSSFFFLGGAVAKPTFPLPLLLPRSHFATAFHLVVRSEFA